MDRGPDGEPAKGAVVGLAVAAKNLASGGNDIGQPGKAGMPASLAALCR